MYRCTLLLLTTTLAAALPVAAQSRVPGPEAAAAALARLQPETPLRLQLRDGSRVHGRFDGLTPGSIRLHAGGQPTVVDLDRLSAAWVRGRQTKAGAIAGGVAGLLFGAFVATIANATCDTEGCGGVGTYFKATAIFLPIGAVVGAGVGSAFPRWRQVLP